MEQSANQPKATGETMTNQPATYTSKESGARVSFSTVDSKHSFYKDNPFAAYGYPSRRHRSPQTIGYFATRTERQAAATEWMKKADKVEAAKKAARAKARADKKAWQGEVTETDKLKVGDILVSTWGYGQTNVDFYRIISRTKCFATVEELGNHVVEGVAWAVDKVIPGDALDKERYPDSRGRINIWNNKENSVNVGDNGRYSASKWGGQPVTRTSYH